MRRSLRVSLFAAASVVLVSGAAVALHGRGAQAQAGITVAVQGPANGSTVANPVAMKVTSAGVTIKAATDQDANAGHYHYFVDTDPATVVKQGQQIPTGLPNIIHSADPNQVLPNLAAGQHTVWVVLAHTDHTPYNPSVQAQVSFTVGAGGAQATPAPGATRAATPAAPNGLPNNGDDFTMLKLIVVAMAALLLAGGYTAVRLSASRR